MKSGFGLRPPYLTYLPDRLDRCYLPWELLFYDNVDIQLAWHYSFFQPGNTGLSRSVRFTTIALLALMSFSGVIMISSPH